MPDLLLELFSEEIPARMQVRAEQDLSRLLTEALETAGLTVGATRTSSGPRRLAFFAEGLPAMSASTAEERKGPRVGAPEKAVSGFLRSAGLVDLAQCTVVNDPKGDYYVARTEKAGRSAPDIIAEVVPAVIRKFPWPKSMRWGAGRIRWVRPLHSILCLFDDKPVKFDVDGIQSGDITYGHRFLSGQKDTEPKSVKIFKSADYAEVLLHAKVVHAREQRAKAILDGAKRVAEEAGLALVEDHGLLEENAGLVEWPVVLSGRFDESFLDVPEEILTTAMKAHQKYFSLRSEKTGKLANRFVLVSNLEAEDGGEAIVAGNERVIRARLSDAKFFWENDRTRPLQEMAELLGQVTFHEKLGTQLQRVERIKRLARELAPIVGADPDKTEEAAALAKADLMSETVGEFPELQGVIGRYIALDQGHDAAVAGAISDHYKPVGQSDSVPTNPVSIAVALADKLDMLVGFWVIDEKPTGSKDPYALRRAALGVIRIVISQKVRVRLAEVFRWSLLMYLLFGLKPERGYYQLGEGFDPPHEEMPEQSWDEQPYRRLLNYDGFVDREGTKIYGGQSGYPGLFEPEDAEEMALCSDAYTELKRRLKAFDDLVGVRLLVENDDQALIPFYESSSYRRTYKAISSTFSDEMLSFFADRLKVYLRDQGARHDLIDAVFALPDQDDLLMVVRRVEALGRFLETEDGASLLVLIRRALNILRIEEKKDARTYDGKLAPKLMRQQEEKALSAAIKTVGKEVDTALSVEDFEGAMAALAKLRVPVDNFFDKVTVNIDDAELRDNRLKLLAQIRSLTLQIADFGKIEG